MRVGSRLFGVDLTAQHNLARAFAQLNQSNTRLATMSRINRGSDDPAGLIAVGQLQSELTAIKAASDSAARAGGAIHVADSGMAEVGNLLNTIHGNLLDVAGGTLSDGQINAKQIEIDAALEAINRIGSYTSFNSRKLLDGSGSFEVSGANDQQISNIEVQQNAGGGQQTLDVEVLQAAASARVTYEGGAVAEDVSLEISGNEGTVVLDFSAGASVDQIAQAVNSTSDSSGVAASVEDGVLTFSSSGVGSDSRVTVEAASGSFDVGEATAGGTDVVANVNGVEFTGQGNQLKINTQTVQADVEFVSGFSGQADPVTISGGAMTFNFSPSPGDTVSLSLPKINAAALGGSTGRLSDLASGGSASLTSGNLARAVDVVDTARNQVLQARARAGAFEKYTIQSSQRVLGNMEENLSSAMSMIQDTDAALEASRLTQSRIMVNAALSSVALASQRRGLVASLLDYL